MRYKLLLIIISSIILLVSCSDSTEAEGDEISVVNQKIFQDFTGRKMIKSTDNSIILGVSNGSEPGIIKLDLNGNKIWEKYYSTTNYGGGFFIDNLTETSDKGFLLCGSGKSGPSGFLTKTDSLGNLIWKKDSIHAWLYRKALENNSGEVIYVKHSGTVGAEVEKYDSIGNLIWSGYFRYNVNNIDLPIAQIYDFAISPENDIYIIYSSHTTKLVEFRISNEGNFEYGTFYDLNCKAGCIFFKDYTHYIFGRYDAFEDDYYSFLYRISQNYWTTEKSYDQLKSFNGYYANNFTDEGGLLATDYDCIVQLDANFELDWSYEVDWTTTEDRFESTIETGVNMYALLGTTKWTENDSTKSGTFLRFFKKN
ncbi:MAG TPA: hypothetical protein PLK90_09315 [Clostridiales bacterium]|nr:hypothetical protein [Clostridiales bacterium]HQP70585.1 hypothetical protein [Clostridiales bacterium]